MMARRFGPKQPSLASKRAAAMQLVVMARELPSAEVLMRSYGLRAAEAAEMLREERERRGLPA